MKATLAQKITNFRKERGLTQQEVASTIGLSRPAYANFEAGNRDLSLREARLLSKLLGFTLDSLQLVDESSIYNKFRELYLTFLQKASADDGKITKTKLAKLIYLADFAWYANHGQPITGVFYRHIQRGPVPDLFFRLTEELFDAGTINIETKGSAMLISAVEPTSNKHLSPEQLTLVEDIARQWKHQDTATIVDFTHKQAPWSETDQGQIIPYDLAKKIKPNPLY